MDDPKINCPHCTQSIEVTPEHANLTVSCPNCSEQFVVPDLTNTAGSAPPHESSAPAEPKEVGKITYILAAIVMPLFFWFNVALHFIGYTIKPLFRLQKIEEGDDPKIAITLALITTVVAPLLAYLYYRKAKSVAENAIEVIGVVKKVGGKLDSMVNVTFSYEVSGKRYKKRKSFDTDGNFSVGQEIELVVDSRKPSRCYLKREFYSQQN